MTAQRATSLAGTAGAASPDSDRTDYPRAQSCNADAGEPVGADAAAVRHVASSPPGLVTWRALSTTSDWAFLVCAMAAVVAFAAWSWSVVADVLGFLLTPGG